MQSIQEIYQKNILPLGEDERLRLVELIIRDIARASKKNGKPDNKGIREMFGTWEGKKLKEISNLDHNEQIDFDLARAYSGNHEDED